MKRTPMIKIFDTHAHYNDADYDEDRETLLAGLPAQGVYAVTNIAVDLATSRQNGVYTETYPIMYGTVGVFPSDVAELEQPGAPEELLSLLAAHEKLVAVGEIGLDYHYEDTDKPLQKKWFEGQLAIARRAGVPAVIHSRDAARDTVDILKSCHAEEIGGVMHCYSYTKELARELLTLDFFFGIGGVVTFKNARKLVEAVEYIPLSRLVLETDAPYLSPEPFRGRRNESGRIPYVAEAIARIKGISPEEVYEATWDNACRLYRVCPKLSSGPDDRCRTSAPDQA